MTSFTDMISRDRRIGEQGWMLELLMLVRNGSQISCRSLRAMLLRASYHVRKGLGYMVKIFPLSRLSERKEQMRRISVGVANEFPRFSEV